MLITSYFYLLGFGMLVVCMCGQAMDLCDTKTHVLHFVVVFCLTRWEALYINPPMLCSSICLYKMFLVSNKGERMTIPGVSTTRGINKTSPRGPC